ncbi:MAG: sulfatase [Microthrixaceae bacterium]
MVDQPNIILINCDDLGYGDLGCYGSGVNKTPAIDGLAADGLRFTSFYMASPVCSPSRGALLTGCYPPRIGFGEFEGLPVLFPGQPLGLPPTEVSIAKVLSDAGYRTQMVGKWHCGDQPEFLPTNHGFDNYFGLPYSNDMGPQVGDHPVHRYPPLPLLLDDDVIEQQPEQSSLTTRYVNEAVRFMRSSRDQPFFLYLAHLYVHLPIYALPQFLEKSTNGTYGAAVESIDWATAVLLNELDRLGLTDDTVVVFTSDNGSLGTNGGSNGTLRGNKGSTWEGGMRVPGIVRWPGRIPAGSTTSVLATAMDLLPTLAGIGGASLPTDRTIDGRDISSIWFDPTSGSPHEVFAYYWMNDLEAIRDHRWKLHFSKHGDPDPALYDLDTDPSETSDVLAEHPEVAARLQAHADTIRASLGDSRTSTVGSDIRPVGHVDEPSTLTRYDPRHPYYIAEYDLADRG